MPRWARRTLLSLLLIPAAGAVLGLGVMVLYYFQSIPLPPDIDVRTTVIYDVNGDEIGTLAPQVGQRQVSLDELPPHVPQTVLASEDTTFYDHPGVSFGATVRALWVNLSTGEISQGGSTISQQYIKTVTADDEVTVMRKLREAVAAVKLENEYSKQEILEFYLNTIYFGRGAYGIEAAAQAYFDKAAADLTQPEAAMLTAIIPSPSGFDPSNNQHVAEHRYDLVINRLLETRWINVRTAGALRARVPEVVDPERLVAGNQLYFLDVVRQELARTLGESNIYRGYEIHTTLDPEVQEAAEISYDRHFDEVDETGALVALDPDSSAIRAIIGGKDRVEDEYNLALRASRQPGSTFKTFALAAWIEQGNSPESIFPAPRTYTYNPCRDLDGNCTVRNYVDTEYPDMTLREATHESVNTVYAGLTQNMGNQEMINLAQAAGVTQSELDPSVDSLVLGSAGVTPMEMASAYNTFAAEGVYHSPMAVTEVRDGDGHTVYRSHSTGERAFSEETARTVTDVLTGVLEDGTADTADIRRPAAAKTGTTSNHADAWFAGYTPDLTAVVWMGNRDGNATMEGEPTGGDLPADVWRDFMFRALANTEVAEFTPPTSDLEVVHHPDADLGNTAPPEPACAQGEQLVEEGNQMVCVAVDSADQAVAEPQPAPEPPEPAPGPEAESAPEAEPGPQAAPEPAPEADPQP